MRSPSRSACACCPPTCVPNPSFPLSLLPRGPTSSPRLRRDPCDVVAVIRPRTGASCGPGACRDGCAERLLRGRRSHDLTPSSLRVVARATGSGRVASVDPAVVRQVRRPVGRGTGASRPDSSSAARGPPVPPVGPVDALRAGVTPGRARRVPPGRAVPGADRPGWRRRSAGRWSTTPVDRAAAGTRRAGRECPRRVPTAGARRRRAGSPAGSACDRPACTRRGPGGTRSRRNALCIPDAPGARVTPRAAASAASAVSRPSIGRGTSNRAVSPAPNRSIRPAPQSSPARSVSPAGRASAENSDICGTREA